MCAFCKVLNNKQLNAAQLLDCTPVEVTYNYLKTVPKGSLFIIKFPSTVLSIVMRGF